MIFADRVGQNFIDPLVVAELEPKVGRACLDAIISFPILEGVSASFSSRWLYVTDHELVLVAAST